MSAELLSTLIINALVIIISIALVMKGKQLRDNKSSSGISASSNGTSTGTALIVCGALIFIAQAISVFKYFS